MVTHHKVKDSIIIRRAEVDKKLWVLSTVQPAEHFVSACVYVKLHSSAQCEYESTGWELPKRHSVRAREFPVFEPAEASHLRTAACNMSE